MVAGVAVIPDADDALRLASAPLEELARAAADKRDAAWGRTLTWSPKVFLPLTNLCRNRCDYCAFRRSPGHDGAHTMTPDEVVSWLDRARDLGCTEALLCLGDTPETGFASYRRTLAGFGHSSTVDYLVWAAEAALERGLLPHTNAGLLDSAAMARLRRVNVSLGLMLESTAERLCEKGGPHYGAPDKHPSKRLAMHREAGALRIPFTSGVLLGIGETRAERVDTLLAIGALHAAHGHVQEVIVQNFRAHAGTPMAGAPEPDDDDIAWTVAMARLLLPAEVTVQTPPNLNPRATRALVAAGINDFGGISPLTPDYINPDHAWPHVDRLGEACAALGFELRPRLPIHDAFIARPGWLDAGLDGAVHAARARLLRSAA